MSKSTLESTIAEILETENRLRQLSNRVERASAVQIGKEIERLRVAKGLSQHELATRCDRSVQTVKAYEAGVRKPRFAYAFLVSLAAMKTKTRNAL